MVSIYKITNKVTNKIYIGQSKDVTLRWKRHCWESNNPKRCKSYLHKSIKKHGSDNFCVEVIHDSLTRDEANLKEIELISYYKSNQDEYGYNITTGGLGHKGVFGDKHPMFGVKRPDLVERNKAGIGRTLSVEHKAKINPTGRKVSLETKSKMSLSRKKAWATGLYEGTNWMRYTETAD